MSSYRIPEMDLTAALDKTFGVVGEAENVVVEETTSPSSPSSPKRAAAVIHDVIDSENQKLGDEAVQPDGSKQSFSDPSEKESKLAEHIANQLRNCLCYDEIGGDWYSQKKGLWYTIPEKRALKLIMQAMDFLLPQGYAMQKLNNIKSFLMIYLLLDEWENNRHLLPLANGILDTCKMTLLVYTDKHKFNWQLPYCYEPKAKLDVIKCWLWDASGQDNESVNIIRAFFKMALVGGDVQKFLELIGEGGTGKSTLVRLLVAFIGEKNHAATDLKNLESNRFEAAALYGKRLALISDSSRYGGEVSVLKALTGGDPVRMEKKNQQQSGSFVFQGVVVVASNEAIQTADYTSGLIRRRMPVIFNRKVTDADKAKWAAMGGIETVMLNELPGLLNWVLAMTDADVKAVIGGINGQMTQAQREHLVETNKIAAWLDDNMVIKADAVVYVGCSMKKKTDTFEIDKARSQKLYANYELWCDEAAVNPVALQRFTANVVDVCKQLHIAVVAMNKDKYGKPIKGLAIRTELHFDYQTPVTRRLLDDGAKVYSDEAVTKKTLASDDVDEDDDVFSAVANSHVDDVEVF
ncbi:MAG: phage/plasmid primase, P4 family [Methylomonas sp.]|jgi:putative DNA primase/helicase|uniref:DNA primase family protein n=1 Tax=Methylomonas sp. TaxID=418 RepID=UPI0025EFAECA|nr:phage/plasmid primase, P4 family [Methylomonas sp.]MCK9606732.1 phage/plasmid primase, P4 family [Methylomonas sp.]